MSAKISRYVIRLTDYANKSEFLYTDAPEEFLHVVCMALREEFLQVTLIAGASNSAWAPGQQIWVG